jgi:hypothetical protein
MARIFDLVRPKTAFDPETIAVLSAAPDEAWEQLLQSGSERTRPAYAGGHCAAYHRYGATGHSGSKGACR